MYAHVRAPDCASINSISFFVVVVLLAASHLWCAHERQLNRACFCMRVCVCVLRYFFVRHRFFFGCMLG